MLMDFVPVSHVVPSVHLGPCQHPTIGPASWPSYRIFTELKKLKIHIKSSKHRVISRLGGGGGLLQGRVSENGTPDPPLCMIHTLITR